MDPSQCIMRHKRLNNRITVLKHNQRAKSIVIAGIPKQPSEVVENIVEKVFKAVEIDVKKEDVVETYRLKNLKKHQLW